MESKSKKFTRKVVAFFLAVIMALSCFTGAMSAFAKSTDYYEDDKLAANLMAWADATDEQTAEALLDYLDGVLSGVNLAFAFSQNIVVATIAIDAHIDSVDGLFDLVRQLDDLLTGTIGSIGGGLGLLGDLSDIELGMVADLPSSTTVGVTSQCGRSYRSQNDAKDIIRALFELIYVNSNNFSGGTNIFGQFFTGDLEVGSILEGVLGGDLYSMLGGMFGMEGSDWKSNAVYNIVANLIWSNTNWFTEEEVNAFKANPASWNFDEQLFSKLGSELLGKINVLVTYPREGEDVDTSATRRAEIDTYMEENGVDYATAASALGYDPNLVYSEEAGFENNVLLFTYGDETLNITPSTSLYEFATQAIKLAWKTVLRDTIDLLHVNYDNKDDAMSAPGTNFDNEFYYWLRDVQGWNTSDWASNYSADNVMAWAEAVYANYGAADAAEFLSWVETDLTWDRAVKEDAKGNWQDIDASELFLKLRYSPLADKYFDIQTGPINLYFLQTGNDIIDAFFDEFSGSSTKYTGGILAGLNDALVAACENIFISSDNIKYGDTAISVPTLAKTGNFTGSDANARATIIKALTSNALALLEYAGNAADMNILNAFYTNNGITFDGTCDNLTEQNLEDAMLPLLITCINQIVMLNPVHDEKWDVVADAEGVAVVALEEYLTFVLPDKDFSVLWTVTDGKLVAASDLNGDGTTELLLDTVMPMATAALGYILQSLAPLRDANWNEWSAYDIVPGQDKTTAFDLLNSLLVYYGEGNTVWSDGTQGQGLAQLLGVVDGSGNSLVTKDNDLWENVDVVFNHLLPVIGVLVSGDEAQWGKASSYDLFYTGIIESILEIEKDYGNGYGGVSNFLDNLLTVFYSAPIYSTGLDITVYDNVLAPLLNAIFGARYDGQGYTHVLPYSSYYDADTSSNTSSATPFNSMLHVDTLGYFSSTASGSGKNWTYTDDGQSTGIIGILLCNIYEAFGGLSSSSYINLPGVDGNWQGISTLVQFVSTFIPGFVPQLREHTFGPMASSIDNPTQTGQVSGTAFATTTLRLNNTSKGLNRFYEDASGTVHQDGRYFMDVTNITVTDVNGTAIASSEVALSATSGKIAPGEQLAVTISGTTPSVTQGKLYQITATYDVYESKYTNGVASSKTADNTIFTGLTSAAYMYLSVEQSYTEQVYPSSRVEGGLRRFAESDEPSAGATSTNAVSTPRFGSAPLFGSSPCWVTLPQTLLVQMSNPSIIDTYGARMRNDTNSFTGSDRSMDGMYSYPVAGTQYYAVSGGTVASSLTTLASDNTAVGYAAIDPATGDILNYDYVDYRTTVDGAWTGPVAAAEVPTDAIETRTHVEWTIEDAIANNRIVGVQRTEISEGEYIYQGVLVTATQALLNAGVDAISWGTPVPGIYIQARSLTVPKNSSQYFTWVKYDGVTELQEFTGKVGIKTFCTNTNNGHVVINFQVVDDTAGAALMDKYNTVKNALNSYSTADFSNWDYNGITVNPFDATQQQLQAALEVASRPVNLETASTFDQEYIDEQVTVDSTTIFGDLAYTQATDIPSAMAVTATKIGNYWYGDKDGNIPIYTNTPVTATATGTITIGDKTYNTSTDTYGNPLIQGEDGQWYLQNLPKYEKAWDTTTFEFPYQYETDVQVGSGEGETPVYEQVSFVYRNADGDKTTSTASTDGGKTTEWRYKLAEASTIVKPNDIANKVENRNVFQQRTDMLQYCYDACMESVITSGAQNIVENISEDRVGMNNVNHVVLSYENMVKVAQSGESLVTTEWIETDVPVIDEVTGEQAKDEATGEPLYEWEPEYSTTASSLQIDIALREYEIWKDRVIDRGYIGDKLEAEIECAAGNAYTAFDFAKTEVPVVDEEGNPVLDEEGVATVTYEYEVTSTATAVPYGAIVDGQLVNEGPIVYTEESWAAYEKALGAAVEIADKGNADATDNDARVSAVYQANCDLRIAENELVEAPAVSSDITVSGTITIATDLAGTVSLGGIVGINVTLADGTVVGTSAADGTFTAVVPAGTTELIITGPSTIDRTVTLAGDANVEGANIPVVMADYNKDTGITAVDLATFSDAYSGDYNVYCDFNGDGGVTALDLAYFSDFYGNTVAYAALALA